MLHTHKKRKQDVACRRYQITFCHMIFGLWKDQAAISMEIEWIAMKLYEQFHGWLIGLAHWLNVPFHQRISFSHDAMQGSWALLLLLLLPFCRYDSNILSRAQCPTFNMDVQCNAMQCTLCIYVKLNQQLLLRYYISHCDVLCDQKVFSPFLDCLGIKWYTRVNYVGILIAPKTYYLYTAHGMLLCFNVIWHFSFFIASKYMRCAFVVSSAEIFGRELFPRAITFVQWCNRIGFFSYFICSFIFAKMKAKTKKRNVIVQFFSSYTLNVHACPIKMVTEGPNRKKWIVCQRGRKQWKWIS